MRGVVRGRSFQLSVQAYGHPGQQDDSEDKHAPEDSGFPVMGSHAGAQRGFTAKNGPGSDPGNLGDDIFILQVFEFRQQIISRASADSYTRTPKGQGERGVAARDEDKFFGDPAEFQLRHAAAEAAPGLIYAHEPVAVGTGGQSDVGIPDVMSLQAQIIDK